MVGDWWASQHDGPVLGSLMVVLAAQPVSRLEQPKSPACNSDIVTVTIY